MIGFAEQVETAPGVWREKITERRYKGEVTRNQTRWSEGSGANDDLRIDNEISIVRGSFSRRASSRHSLRDLDGIKMESD